MKRRFLIEIDNKFKLSNWPSWPLFAYFWSFRMIQFYKKEMRKFLHLVASCLKRSKMKTRTVHNVHITDLKLKVYLLCTSWLIYKGTVSHFLWNYWKFSSQYSSRVAIHDRRAFIRLATGLFLGKGRLVLQIDTLK